MGIRRRLSLMRGYYAAERDWAMPLLDLAHGMFALPSTFRSRRYIQSLAAEGDFLRVDLRGLKRPIYWPYGFPRILIHRVVTECFDPNDWHFYEVPETTVSPGDVVLDCGAAEGAFGLRVLERAGAVVAFEPLADFVTCLRRTYAKADGVTIIPQALGAEVGIARLVADSGLGSTVQTNGDGPFVPVTTIDTWRVATGSRVDFIKADLEGSEQLMLEGALETIESCHPKIAITTYHPANDWAKMIQLVRGVAPSYRYRLKGLSMLGSRPRPVMLHMWVPVIR
jgi:FkbM family methyltransferase